MHPDARAVLMTPSHPEGQSIPNREDVKVEKGVKIYFDAVETAARVEINKGLVRKVYHDADAVLDTWRPDAVEMLVWHVAAHEVGTLPHHAPPTENLLADADGLPRLPLEGGTKDSIEGAGTQSVGDLSVRSPAARCLC